jgi:enamine deaminase RidA (YjgF/YER057c/UK114 family)
MAPRTRQINADAAPKAIGNYTQALEVSGAARVLYISGQIPERADGTLPSTFRDQAETAWANVIAQLHAADMTVDNLVKVTIFLSDRKYAVENRNVRLQALQGRTPALTCIITGIFDAAWLLEIEAIAAA